MERTSIETLPSPEQPLSRDIYLTPESIAIAALVDAMDRRVLERKEEDE